MTLTEFLLTRIAEDEAAARAATAGARTGNWWLDPDEGGVTEVSCLDVQGFVTAVDVDAAHIARHDPARVLAECEAKRRLVERAARALRWDRNPEGIPAERVADWAWSTLEDIAAIYADHPDCRAEWKP